MCLLCSIDQINTLKGRVTTQRCWDRSLKKAKIRQLFVPSMNSITWKEIRIDAIYMIYQVILLIWPLIWSRCSQISEDPLYTSAPSLPPSSSPVTSVPLPFHFFLLKSHVPVCSNYREILPCTLNLGNCNPTFLEGDVPTFRGEADSDSDVDDNDYLTVHPYHLLGDS